VKQVYAVNPHTVVVLIASFPFSIQWTQDHIPAILHMAHNSQEEGNALADALFGDYNPGGRLVTTWPASLEQLPPMMDYNIRDGRTYMYFKGKPLYPFGYGLSYTTFEYSNLRSSAGQVAANGEVTVSFDLRNAGSRSGDEVVQMYVSHVDSKVARAQEELKGFQRVSLQPQKRTTVKFTLKAADLAYWNSDKAAWDVESDQVEIRIGSSSADIKLKTSLKVNSLGE